MLKGKNILKQTFKFVPKKAPYKNFRSPPHSTGKNKKERTTIRVTQSSKTPQPSILNLSTLQNHPNPNTRIHLPIHRLP